VQALTDVSLEVQRGSFVLVLGPSGSGKSTLLTLLGGLDRPTDGEIRLREHDYSRLSENGLAKLRGEHIGFVFQSFNLIGNLNALENVILPLRIRGMPEKKARAAAGAQLKRVGLGGRLRHLPGELSGGEQQRAALARALVTSPDLLLADEPTGNLDSASSQAVKDLLRELNRGGQTMVVVSHDESFQQQATHVIRMKDGRIVSLGNAR
jgi:putative ABC transport system ATP-binding protein